MTSLPPDPEKMNDARAAWASATLRCFQQETGTDEESALPDLLCDLMHWSDRNDHDFEKALSRARLHYQAETTRRPPQPHEPCQRQTSASTRPIDERYGPYWLQQVETFEGFEIQPHIVIHGSCCGSYLEPCERNEAELWTVNGRYRSGGLEPCEDFDTEAEARAFVDALISVFPHLAGRQN